MLTRPMTTDGGGGGATGGVAETVGASFCGEEVAGETGATDGAGDSDGGRPGASNASARRENCAMNESAMC